VGIDRTDAYAIGLALVLSYTTQHWEDAAVLMGAYAYLRYHYMRVHAMDTASAPPAPAPAPRQQRQQQRPPAYYYTQQHVPVIARRVRSPGIQWGPRMDFATQ
jgi:hypothetical protein